MLAQVGGAVLLGGSGGAELAAAAEEGLLLLLSVSSQHLLGQAQPLIGLLLLRGRAHHADGRRRRGGGAFGQVLNDLCEWGWGGESERGHLCVVIIVCVFGRARACVVQCARLCGSRWPCLHVAVSRCVCVCVCLNVCVCSHQTLAGASCPRHGRWCCCSCTGFLPWLPG